MGTVVVAGRSYQVTGLALRGGRLEITASGPGPMVAVEDEPVTVFGADEQGVCQGWRISIPVIPAGRTATITLPLQITSIETLPGETTVIHA